MSSSYETLREGFVTSLGGLLAETLRLTDSEFLEEEVALAVVAVVEGVQCVRLA